MRAMNVVAASRQETIAAFVARSKRQGTVGIRQTFLQPGRGAKAGQGVLASFVSRRDDLGLDLYLLLLLIGRGSQFGAHFIDVQSGTWTRALGLKGKSANQVLSRALGRLERLKLVKRTRTRKGVRVQLLKEDGKGSNYSPPSGNRNDPYFQLPVEYWLEDHYIKLRTPGKAMLLIALGEEHEFELQVAKVPAYYGISPETADRGFDELVMAGLARFEQRVEKDPLGNLGHRTVKVWRLQGPYERQEPPAKEAVLPLRRVK